MSTVDGNVLKQRAEAERQNDWDIDWVEELPFYAAEMGARIKKSKLSDELFRYEVKDRWGTYLTVESSKDIKSFFIKPSRKK